MRPRANARGHTIVGIFFGKGGKIGARGEDCNEARRKKAHPMGGSRPQASGGGIRTHGKPEAELNIRKNGQPISGLAILYFVRKICHCEPVTCVTGVAIP